VISGGNLARHLRHLPQSEWPIKLRPRAFPAPDIFRYCFQKNLPWREKSEQKKIKELKKQSSMGRGGKAAIEFTFLTVRRCMQLTFYAVLQLFVR
jgi:hypothetical protein